MVGQTPAPWFVEVNGQKQGPYTNEQIMKLLMDGALKVESRIFDSATNVWKIAADVIPYLDLSPSREKESSRKTWTPPPKPTELRDVHIVDLNADATGDVDYFALINDQRRIIDRQRTNARMAAARDAEIQKLKRSEAARFTDRSAPNEKRPELAKTVRAIKTSEPSIPTAVASSPSTEPSLPKPGTDGILAAEVEPAIGLGLGNVIVLAQRTQRYIAAHKGAFSVAAALAFVFAGTYGTVRMLSERKGREPANITETRPKAPAESPKAVMGRDDALGSGRNKVKRRKGSISSSGHARGAAVATPNPTSEIPRDPPQYYNSGDETPVAANAVAVPQTTPDQANSNANADPNNGVVNPPSYIPQPDPNHDANRNPSAQ